MYQKLQLTTPVNAYLLGGMPNRLHNYRAQVRMWYHLTIKGHMNVANIKEPAVRNKEATAHG